MNRRHDIDALRVIAFCLLILYHVAMVYVADWDFHLKSGYQAEWLQWPMIALNRWRMPLLFMLSGMAIGLAGMAGGRSRLAMGRLRRLLPPLLFGILVVVALQAYCEARANGGIEAGLGAFLLRYWQLRPWPGAGFTGAEYGFTWNHLWYLAYLLAYTLLLAAALPLLDRLRDALATRLRPGWLLLPFAWLAIVRLWIAPRFPETHAFVGDWTVHAESLPLFLLGFLLARNARFWDWVVARRRHTLALALAALTTELGLRWLLQDRYAGAQAPASLLVAWRVARAGYAWAMLLCLFGWAKAWLDRPWPWLAYCSQAVFPWYVLHQTLIVLLAYWLIPMQLPAWLEAAAALFGTIGGCLLLNEYLIRRIDWLRPLFGLPRPQARPARPGKAQAATR